MLLLLGSQALDPFHLSKALAEETPLTTDNTVEIPTETTAATTTNGEITDETVEQKEIPKETTATTDGETTNEAVEQNEIPTETTAATTSTDGETTKETVEKKENPTENTATTIERVPTKQAFLDISINGEPIGRIVIELNADSAPAGVARFSGLVSGAAGISYRRKEFIKITPNYVQHGGVRSYGVDAELAKQTGSNLEADSLIAELESENEKSLGTKNVAGSVGIVVRDPTKPPPKLKLVARKGKLEIDEEQVGKDPNGTEFVIAMKDSPELDASTLVIGKVLEGMEVVKRIGQVKTVNENTSSPYFRVAKLIGDKRAVVAERGFNRPYAKVVVTNCGLM